MLSLQNMCINKICQEPLSSLSILTNYRHGKISSLVANKLMPPLLKDISAPKCFLLSSRNILSKINFTDLSHAKKPFPRMVTQIIISSWREQLQTLVFPFENNFLDISFKGSEFEKLRRLELRSPSNLDKRQLLELIAVLPAHLESLSLTGCKAVDQDVLRHIGQKCPGLKFLDLSSCSYVTAIPETLNQLQEICIGYTEINDAGLVQLGRSAGKSLIRLDIRNCRGITMFPTTFIALEEVNLEQMHFHDEALEQLARGAGNSLKKMNLRINPSIKNFPATFTALEEVNLCHTKIHDEGLGQLAKGSGNSLRKINLSDCTKFKNFPETFTALEEADLSDTKIHDAGLEQLARGSGSSLRKIDLQQNTKIKTFPKTFTVLEEVDLGYTKIKDEGLAQLEEGSGKSLIKLNLVGCKKITQLPPTFTVLQEVVHPDGKTEVKKKR